MNDLRTLMKTFQDRLSVVTTFVGVAQMVDLVIDWTRSGTQTRHLATFRASSAQRQRFFFIYKKKCKHCLSDWPSQRNLLEVFVSMSCSGGMSDALEEMKALRNRNLRDTRE